MAISNLLFALSAAHRREIATEITELRALSGCEEFGSLKSSAQLALLERDLKQELHIALDGRASGVHRGGPSALSGVHCNGLNPLHPTGINDAIARLYQRGKRLILYPFRQNPTAIDFLQKEGFTSDFFLIEVEATEGMRTYLNKAAELPSNERRLLGTESAPLIREKKKVVDQLARVYKKQNLVGITSESTLQVPITEQPRAFTSRLFTALGMLSFCLLIGELHQGEQPSRVMDHLTQGAIFSCLPPSIGLTIGGIEWMLS